MIRLLVSFLNKQQGLVYKCELTESMNEICSEVLDYFMAPGCSLEMTVFLKSRKEVALKVHDILEI